MSLAEILRRLGSADERVRDHAMELLSASDDLRATAFLERAVASEGVGPLAVKGERLLRILKERVRSRIPPGALEASDQGRRFTIKGLRSFFEREPAPPKEERLRVLDVVATLHNPRLVGPLGEIARSCDEAELRRAAVTTMGAVGEGEAFRRIQTFLGDPSEVVRCGVCDALFLTGVLHAYPCLVVALSDEAEAVRRRARYYLGRLGAVNLSSLFRRLMASTKPWRREAVARAVGCLAEPKLLALLPPLIEDRDAEVRQAARASLEVLAEHGYEEARSFLETLDALSTAQAGAAPAGASPSLAEARLMLSDSDSERRIEAVERLVRDGGPERAKLLVERLGQEDDVGVISSLLDGLGEMGEASLKDWVEPLFSHGDARVRAEAVMAYARLSSPGERACLAPLLEDVDVRVRAASLVALRDTSGVDLVEPLVSMVFSGDVQAQLSAANAIDGLGGEVFVTLLRPLIMSTASAVRLRAAAVLQNLIDRGNDEARELLAMMQEGPKEEKDAVDWSGYEAPEHPEEAAGPGQVVAWGSFEGSAEIRLEDLLSRSGPSKIRWRPDGDSS